jgi:hypothetical protein
VRDLYPLDCNQGPQARTNIVGSVPAVATEAEPGSAEKIEVMRQRVLRGEQIFHPLDGLPLKRMRLAMEELRKFADLVQQMRVAQRAYFRKRTGELLELSKKREREVDQAVKAILDQTHPTLFDQQETVK